MTTMRSLLAVRDYKTEEFLGCFGSLCTEIHLGTVERLIHTRHLGDLRRILEARGISVQDTVISPVSGLPRGIIIV